MKTNQKQLVMQSVQGKIHHPTMRGAGYRVGYDGKGRIPMATGGITYNFKIGDSCMAIAGDHIEPCVSMKNADSNENDALQSFACIGNIAKIISGDAKGKTGFVTGKHGGVDHVMVHFDETILDALSVDDKILIKAYGQGLKLLDYPDIHIMNIDPHLLDKFDIKEEDGVLIVPVTHVIPACLMGSGLGSSTTMSGDYDIMSQDQEANKTYHLDSLRFGDIVMIQDHENHYGPHYRQGAVSIGVITHSDSYTSGHGPGVTVIMSAKTPCVKPCITVQANIANYLLEDA